MGLLHLTSKWKLRTKQRQMGQWKAVASSRPERLARKRQGAQRAGLVRRAGNCPGQDPLFIQD